MIREAASHEASVPTPRNALETFSCTVIGTVNGVALQAHGRTYVVQLASDSEDAFQAVLDAIDQAYAVHRQQHRTNNRT